MRLLFGALTSALFVLFANISSPALAKADVPLTEYGKLPDVEDSAISPSGDKIAMVTTRDGKRIILVLEDQTKAIFAVQIGDMKLRSIRWAGEDALLLVSSQTESLRGFTVDKAEFYVARLLPISDAGASGVVFGAQAKLNDSIHGSYGMRKIDGRYYAYFGAIEFVKRRGNGSRMANWALDHTRPHLYQVDLQDLSVEKVSTSANEGFDKDWIVDARGEVAYSLDINETTGQWVIRNRDKKKIVEGRQLRGAVSLVGLSFDGSRAIYVERTDDGSDWREIGQEGGEPTDFLEGVDFEGLFFNPETGYLMGYTVGEDDLERHVFADKGLQKKAERVRKAFATYESSFAGWTSDLSDVLIRTSGNDDSGTYYAVDLSTSRANAIAYERMAIGPDQVGPISTFEYTASDGMEMDGILTLPPGMEPTNLPVVMLPHGGPGAADYPEFDWWAQAFASRGYAVFQPNFRGSTNRTVAFRRAGYGEWGGKMQTDKSDGLKALADAGIVDSDRACIVGASYGGYAALAGVTLQQGLYKCAVAVAPVVDLRDMYNEDYRASGRDRTTKVALLEQLGERSKWDGVSPLRKAELADAPIMLIHGVDDTVVPYSHSSKMADKLKDYGKTYELVTLEGEDHWLSLSATRQAMLNNAVRWVEEYNPPN